MPSTTDMKEQIQDLITIGGENIEVWPGDMEAARICEEPTFHNHQSLSVEQ